MKAFMTVSDPESFQLLADATRRKVVYLLRVKELTVNQLAAELDLTPQTVYFHVRKLLKGKMVEVVREERVGHLIESYYRATAESFGFVMGKAGGNSPRTRKLAIDQERAVLDALVKLGYNLKYDDQAVNKLVELMAEEKPPGGEDREEKISSLSLDPVTQMTVSEHAWALSATNEEYKKADDAKRKFREALLAMVK
jgi:DNA-binding transcriptional ArsR family regulator